MPDQPVEAMPTAGDSPACTLAANGRVGADPLVGFIRKETVTPKGVFGSGVGPQVQSDGQQDREEHLILVCTQLVDGVPDVGDDHITIGALQVALHVHLHDGLHVLELQMHRFPSSSKVADSTTISSCSSTRISVFFASSICSTFGLRAETSEPYMGPHT